jgi:hypothetical protein
MPPNYIDIGGPGQQPGVGGGPGSLPPWVMPPIAPGGIGRPPHPSQGPGFPTHPIAPGGGGGGGGGQPPGFWGGTPPVYIDIGPPGQQPQPPDDPSKIEWHTGWTQQEGWVTVGIVKTDKPIPTPSKGQE